MYIMRLMTSHHGADNISHHLYIMRLVTSCVTGGEMGEIYGEWCQCDNLQCDRDKSGQGFLIIMPLMASNDLNDL